ncbi:chitinase [Curtobacterium sp. MCBD17_013]|uniref:endo-beta-N-acetylglucosaminidase H n=1 Tax=Curtobacterium sp. MCBD17_013 TaxID=2175668 RepID=UPI000DA85337|nr:endo-beta-N-acetylglucosaminidase H [Curtobacterium sp. MCBD17_013]PZF65373.1 chitinase [Curtobacterium sp. MCBD17_013]
MRRTTTTTTTTGTRGTVTPRSTRRWCIGAAAAITLAAVPLAPSAANAATAGRPDHGHQQHHAVKHGPTSVAYVEVNNDQLANVGRYTLADGANAFDIGIIFAANIDDDGTKAQLSLNANVQATLDQAATQIRPLQAKGIKVELSILGNHQGAGIANFSTPAAAADFARQVRDVVTKYRLDGIDLDDEYSDYGVNGTPQPNAQSIGWLISALRADLPHKLLSFYDIGPASTSLDASSPRIGSKLDYAWNPYYGTYSAPATPGLPKSRLSPAAVDIQSTPIATAQALARRTEAEHYGVFMTYDLPDGDDSAYVSALMQSLYGQGATYR